MRIPTGAKRREQAKIERNERLQQWHPFFCLLPRVIGDELVWLETVLRKCRWDGYGYNREWIKEYRIPYANQLGPHADNVRTLECHYVPNKNVWVKKSEESVK